MVEWSVFCKHVAKTGSILQPGQPNKININYAIKLFICHSSFSSRILMPEKEKCIRYIKSRFTNQNFKNQTFMNGPIDEMKNDVHTCGPVRCFCLVTE